MDLASNLPMLSWWSLRQPASWPTRPLATLNERLLRDIGLQAGSGYGGNVLFNNKLSNASGAGTDLGGNLR